MRDHPRPFVRRVWNLDFRRENHMPKRMLIDATHPEETRVVVADGNDLLEYDYETSTKRQIKSNIYLAKVTRVEPSLQAAFVDFGGNRHGFLAFSEIHPDYYQIPVEDREKLLAEESESEEEDDEENGNTPDGDDTGGEKSESDADDNVVGEDDDEDIHELADSHRKRLRKLTRSYKIQEVIKRRQILLVQVVKEERGNKGAALTTYLSLPGRYCVLMPNTSRGGGISRKITDPKHRKAMKSIMSEMEVPDGMAVIMRTAGVERTKAEIKRDYEYLRRVWDETRELTMDSTAPALIYEEGDVIKRALRDIYDRDIDEVLIEGDDAYKAAKALMRTMIPSHAKRVQKYDDSSIPLFNRYQIDQHLDAIHDPVVQLKSGGYLVINPTEALVAIDVNSGRSTRERNVEQTAYRTNLEAAEEVARQLRLRDLAGLVVIDFIDMDVSRNNHAVERKLKEAMKTDRARIQIGRISSFGLLEMSRQRLRSSLHEAHTQTCPVCQGAGFVRSTESTSMAILRELEEEGLRKRTNEVTVTAQTEIALYLLNQKRDTLREIEERHDIRILVTADSNLTASEYQVGHSRSEGDDDKDDRNSRSARGGEKRDEDAPKRRRRRGRKRSDENSESDENAKDTEAEDTAETDTSEAESDDEDGAKRNSRRRGRRGGRRRRKSESDTDASESENGENADASPARDDSEEDSDAETGNSPDVEAAEDDEDAPKRRRRRPRRRGRRTRDTGEVDTESATGDNSDESSAEASGAESADDAETEVDTDLDIPEPKQSREAEAPTVTEPVPDSTEDKAETETPEPEPEAETAETNDAEAQPDAEPDSEAVEAEAEKPEEPEDDNRPRRSGWWSRAAS
jgi:ribonuclease E